MREVIPIGKKSKQEVERILEMAAEMESRVDLIQALIPAGLEAAKVLLQDEVRALAGERYQREGRKNGCVRWGRQKSSMYLGDQKVPVMAPRLRNSEAGMEIPLMSLEQLQIPRSMDEGLFRKVLKGLSCRDYRECAEAVSESFGLSASTVSRRHIRASAKKLKALMERRLGGYDFIALILDGKTFAKDEMVIAVGITSQGEKVILGFVQTATENEKVVSAFLRELVDRGLKFEEDLLVILDGSKGIRKAVEKVLGDHAEVQRCQWHKRENVVKYLPDKEQAFMRWKLQAAYEQPTYAEAKGHF